MTSGSVIACDSSAKRASIWSTSPSITACEGTAAACRLGDDLDADELLGRVLARRLDREHRLHGGDRDGELVEVRLARGELLQHQARPHHRAHPALAAVAAGGLDYLEREPGDERGAAGSRGRRRRRETGSQYHAGRPIGANRKIATIMTMSRKLVPQRGCSREKRCAFSGVSGRSASKQEIVLCSAPWYSKTRRRSRRRESSAM